MLQTGHAPEATNFPLGSLKRPRAPPDKMVQSNSKKIVVERASGPASLRPAITEAVREQKHNLITTRFKRAMKKNDSTMLQRCIESGYKPAIGEWLSIIGKMHVNTALKCVQLSRHLESACISAAIRRQHPTLFKEVIERVDCIPETYMQNLMVSPAFYLEQCITKGLNPNIPLKNKRLPLEHACAHSRIGHIEILLKDPRTSVSQNVCRFMIRQTKQQRFAPRAIELCDNVVPNMILEAVVANVTEALTSVMAKLELIYEDHPQWDELTHMLTCCILNDYTTDIVKTPVNDHYYDRQSILKWVRAKGSDPLTREPLQESDLMLRSEFLNNYAGILQAKIKKLEE